MSNDALQKVFKAYDVRSTYPDLLNVPVAKRIGYAAGQFFSRTASGAKTQAVLVSRDMRPHSPELANALCDGLRAAGLNVIDLGMCDTSFQYFAINHLDAIAGIQTTASHNPIHYNGFKMSSRQAKPIGADTGLKEIQKLALASPDADQLKPIGSYEERDLWNEYRQHVLKFLAPLPRPMKVFIDASNGMGGKLIPRIFDNIPNLEIIKVNFEIGQGFAHEPNPLVAKNMLPTQQGVRQHKAALGACFDGDADRCILTDETGTIIGCDHLTALLCEHFLKQAPGAAVLYDLRSSKAVEEEVLRLGGVPRKSRVGHVFMKALLRETAGIFGGELSGHFYFRDNYFCDSGAIAFAAVLSVLAGKRQPLSQLIAPYKKYPQSGERNFHVEDKAGALAAVKAKYANVGTIDELDGVTVDAWNQAGWWANVRASNTEPLLRLNAEARDDATLAGLLKEITPMLGTPEEGH